MNNQALAEALGHTARRVRKQFYNRPAPVELCHYTKRLEAAISILETRSLWANALSAQTDTSEINYALELFSDDIREQLSRSSPPSFKHGILSCLPEAVAKARERVYITCFCTNNDSTYHWDNYGDFCFSMPFFMPPSSKFTTRHQAASVWLHPVIYSRNVQEHITTVLLDDIASAIERNCWGVPQGSQFDEWYYKSGARAVSDVLLSFLSSFKDPKFEPEQEWRLVACPKLSAFHSAPSMLTEAFDLEIDKLPFEHVSLTARRQVSRGGVFVDEVFSPWTQVIQKPTRSADDRQLLKTIIERLGVPIRVA